MKIIDRYIMLAVLTGVGAASLIIVTLASFFSLLGQLGDIRGNPNYGFADALYFVIMTTPRRLYEVFPLSVLIGALFGLGNLAASSELIVIRAAGVSIGRITLSVLMVGLLLMVIDFAIGEWVAPPAEQAAQEHKIKQRTTTKDNKGGHIDLRRKYGFWSKEKNNIIRITKVVDLHNLQKIEIYSFNNERKLVAVVSADTGHYKDGNWTLKGVKRSTISEDKVRTSEFTELQWGKLVDPDRFKSLMVPPENQALVDLAKTIENLESNRVNTDKYRLAYWIKIFTPMSTLVMMLIAIPFIFRTIRTTNTGQRLFFGVLIGLGFYVFNQGMNSVGLLYGIPPMISAALPSLLFAGFGIFAIRRVG